MRRLHLAAPTTLASLLVLACTIAGGCGGMDRYNDKDEPITDPADAEGEPPQILVDECPSLCAIAYDDLAPLGCNVDCAIDLGLTFDGEAGVSVLFSLLTVEADGEFQTGGSCDVAVTCEDLSPCAGLALECLEDSNNDAGYCIDEFQQCDAEQHCQDIHEACLEVAEATNQACIDDGTPLDECVEIYEAYVTVCECDYQSCLGAPEDPDCEESPPPVPPLPLTTGPGRWDVPRSFLHHHLDRVGVLQTSFFTTVVPDATGTARGVRLRSIEPGDPAHVLGLRDGDVVLELDGRHILDFVDQPLALLGVLDKPNTTAVVRRAGVNRTLRYRFVP